MEKQFVGHLSLALSDFGKLQNYADDLQAYSDLAWKGLIDTPQFKSLSEKHRTRIIDRTVVEQFGAERDGIKRKDPVANCLDGN